MKTGKRAAALLRAGGVMSMVVVLVAGVTFAALRSQNNIISGSHMTSASANLMLSKQANAGFANAIAGYNFFDLQPGGPAGPQYGNDLYLRNAGTTNLDLKVSLDSSRMAMINGAKAQHTYLVVVDADGVTQYAKYSLGELADAYVNGSPLSLNLVVGGGGSITNLKLRMQLDDDGPDVTQQQAIENIDLVFSGVSV